MKIRTLNATSSCDRSKSSRFSRDGVSLAVCSFDGEVRFFGASSRSRTSLVQCARSAPLRCLGFSPAAQLLVCGNDAGELRLLGTDDGQERKLLEAVAIPSMASSLAALAVCAGPVSSPQRL